MNSEPPTIRNQSSLEETMEAVDKLNEAIALKAESMKEYEVKTWKMMLGLLINQMILKRDAYGLRMLTEEIKG